MPGQPGENRTDDPDAFEVLFDRYHDAVFRQIVLLTRDHAAAEDIAQETWLRIARGLKTFEGRSGFYAWACRIASNEVKRHWRRNARPRVLSQEPGHDPRDGRVTADLVHEALRRIPEKYRQPLLLELWESWSLKEIGEALGLPEGTVKSRLHRAREKFRAIWSELGGEE
jgi:RNA polymerase sigma-70 factor (ECF subfamily)